LQLFCMAAISMFWMPSWRSRPLWTIQTTSTLGWLHLKTFPFVRMDSRTLMDWEDLGWNLCKEIRRWLWIAEPLFCQCTENLLFSHTNGVYLIPLLWDFRPPVLITLFYFSTPGDEFNQWGAEYRRPHCRTLQRTNHSQRRGGSGGWYQVRTQTLKQNICVEDFNTF